MIRPSSGDSDSLISELEEDRLKIKGERRKVKLKTKDKSHMTKVKAV